MTRTEYLQLVQSSNVFKNMEKEFQDEVVNATAEKMSYYADLMQDYDKSLLHAKKNYVELNKKIMKNLTDDIKKMSKEKLKNDESKSCKVDAEVQEKLLQEINFL